MRIVSAETILVEIPFKLEGSGIGIMPRVWNTLEFALVRLEDECGNVGWGEGFGYSLIDATKSVIDRLILPGLVGAEVDDIVEWNARTQRQLHMFGRYGVTMFAISGVDIALWDLKAKRVGLPLSHLLAADGPVRKTLPIYASLVRYSHPELVARVGRQARQRGFDTIKLHEVALPAIEACRQAVGPDIRISNDVNCGWTAAFVEEAMPRLGALCLEWIEEPIFPPEDFQALASLRGRGVAIAAGENWCTQVQFAEALRHGSVDIFQPSVTKVGGISELVRCLDLVEGAGGRAMPHSPYFGPGFYATMAVAAARNAILDIEYNFVEPDAWLSDVAGLLDGPTITPPAHAGLGFEPDPEILSRYRRKLGARHGPS